MPPRKKKNQTFQLKKKKEKIQKQIEIEADSEKTESEEEPNIPVKKSTKVLKKNMQCRSKKSSTSQIDRDEEEGESEEQPMIPVRKANKGVSKKNIKLKSKKSSTSEIDNDEEEGESEEQPMIPVRKANKGVPKKNIKLKSKKSSTSEIDNDEEEGGSSHNNSDEEESNHSNSDEEEVLEKKKSKRCAGKEVQALALIAKPSKKVYTGDRPYRAGLSALVAFKHDMEKQQLSLTTEQNNVLKETPFSDLFMMVMENNYTTSSWNKIDEAFTKLLSCLKEATGKEIVFEFDRGGEKYTMTSTPEKLAVILGVPCIKGRRKETKNAMRGNRFRESEFYIKYFGKKKSAEKRYIRDAIFHLLAKTEPPLTRKDNEDLVMLIGLFMCNTIFFTTKDAGAIKEKYLGLVQDFNKCKTLSWAHLIHSELAKRLNKSFNNPIKTSGCVFYLPIWFAEQTRIVEPMDLSKEKFVPRASRWNLTKICKEFLKDMNASNFVFRENFFDEITEKERVALGISEEGGSTCLVQDREENNLNLSKEIKISYQVVQDLIANNVEVHTKVQEVLNELYLKACGRIVELKNDTTPAVMMCTTSNDACVTPAADLQDDSVKAQSNKATSSVQSKNDTTPAAMMCSTSNDACVTPAADLQDDSVRVQSNKATSSVQSKNDTTPAAMMCSTTNGACVTPAADLLDDSVKVQSNTKYNSFTSREQDPLMDFVTCSLGDFSPLPSQEKRVELVFDEALMEENIADSNVTVPEPKNANAEAIDANVTVPEQSSADTNATVPQPKHVVDAETSKTLLADAEPKAGESKRKRKKIENTKAGDGIKSLTAKNLTKDGLSDDKTSKPVYSNTSLSDEKLQKDGLSDDKTSEPRNSNTSFSNEKLPKDVEGNTLKDGLPLVNLEQKINRKKRKNMSVEVSSVVTDVITREDRTKKQDAMYTGGSDYSEKNFKKTKSKFNIDSREERMKRRNNMKLQEGNEPLQESVVQKKKRQQRSKLKTLQRAPVFKEVDLSETLPISQFFSGATLSSAAWTVYVGVEPNKFALSVYGKTIEDLMYNQALEADIISYTTYKLQKAFEEDQGNLGDKKYLKVLHMDPSAWTFVQDIDKCAGLVEDTIKKPIIEMDTMVDRILIPMLHGVRHNKHWTLLIFYVNKRYFEHFNSWDVSKKECLHNAKVMAEFCLEHINSFLEANKKPKIHNIQVNEVQVPQQGPTKNCLLYVRHFIQKRSRFDFKNSKEVDFKSEEVLLNKMERKRASLVYKLLTAKAPEICWNPSDEDQK